MQGMYPNEDIYGLNQIWWRAINPCQSQGGILISQSLGLARPGLPGKLSTGQVLQFLATKIPHLPSPHISFSLQPSFWISVKPSESKVRPMVKSKASKESRMPCDGKQRKTSRILLKQPPFTTNCSTGRVLCTPFGTWPKKAAGPSQRLQGACQCEAQICAFASTVPASVHHLLAKTVILL